MARRLTCCPLYCGYERDIRGIGVDEVTSDETEGTGDEQRRKEETRLPSARATLELHETLGPALTTRSAKVKRAGVGRPTLYGHFPDELSLGKACSPLDLSENPLPDPGLVVAPA